MKVEFMINIKEIYPTQSISYFSSKMNTLESCGLCKYSLLSHFINLASDTTIHFRIYVHQLH